MNRSITLKTLRNTVIFLAICMAVLVPCFAQAAGNAVINVSLPGDPIIPGQEFIVNIDVTPNNAIAGMQFNLSFDPDLVTINGVTEGDLLNHAGANTYFNAGQIDSETGTISNVFGAIISPGETVSADGTFAVITMTAATSSGDCPLVLSNVIVGDAQGTAISTDINNATITLNVAPVLASIGNKNINEGEALSFVLSATDFNGDTLTYSAQNLPSGALFNSGTREFSWTPSYSQSGTYSNVLFEVSDGSLSDSEIIQIVVANAYQPDVNGDGDVNVLDIISIAQHWEQTGANGWIVQDINENGTVNVLDIIIVGQYWTI